MREWYYVQGANWEILPVYKYIYIYTLLYSTEKFLESCTKKALSWGWADLSTGAQGSQANKCERRLATRKLWELRKRRAGITAPNISSDATDSTSTARRSTGRWITTLDNPIPRRQKQHRHQEGDYELAHPSVKALVQHHGYYSLKRSIKHACKLRHHHSHVSTGLLCLPFSMPSSIKRASEPHRQDLPRKRSRPEESNSCRLTQIAGDPWSLSHATGGLTKTNLQTMHHCFLMYKHVEHYWCILWHRNYFSVGSISVWVFYCRDISSGKSSSLRANFLVGGWSVMRQQKKGSLLGSPPNWWNSGVYFVFPPKWV